MKCSTPGFPVFHCLPEFAQTHIHWVDDVIKSSHLLSPPSPLVPNHCQNQSFSMSQLSALGGQSIGARASALVLPMNIQDWFPLGLNWLYLLSVQRTLKSLLQCHSSEASILRCLAFFMVWLSHPYMTTGKNHSFDYTGLCQKVMSLLFNALSIFVIKRLFSSSLSAISVVSSAYLRLLIFLPAILIPACASSRPAFHIMFSAYKLNKQGDKIQPWRTPFLIWNQSVGPCPVLTVASWPEYRFLRNKKN